jgi:hypothetical protein
MKYLKEYAKFLESIQIDLTNTDFQVVEESLTVWQDNLVSSFKGKEIQFKKFFDIKSSTLTDLVNNVDFVKVLIDKKLKKTEIFNTDDYDTFFGKSMLFVNLMDIDANDLMNPKYILCQFWDDDKNKWSSIKMYEVNDDIKNFYDKLSSKTIELVAADKNYIYKTSNSGNDWELQNLLDEHKIFKRYLSTDEIKNLIKLNIIHTINII